MSYIDIDCSTEQVQRLKPQIKRKISELIDLEADSIDDNLVVYSLLLFENRHTKDKIVEDLSNFLPKNTSTPFVEWLWTVLEPISNRQKLTSFSSVKKNQAVDVGRKESRTTENTKKPDNKENSLYSTKTSKATTETKNKPQKRKIAEIKQTPKVLQKEKSDDKKAKTSRNPDVGEKPKKMLKSAQKVDEAIPKSDSKKQKTDQTEFSARKLDKKGQFGFQSTTLRDVLSIGKKETNGKKEEKAESKADAEKIENALENFKAKLMLAKNSLERENGAKQTKSHVHCTFWPNCMKGDNCPYTHPDEPSQKICSYYPKCFRGANCHFLHVDDSRGPFPRQSAEKCFYGVRCKNPHCSFVHPRPRRGSAPCRDGSACRRPNCAFEHPQSTPSFPSSGNAPEPSASTNANLNLNGKPLCRFDQKCQKINCQFYHPLRDRGLSFLLNSQRPGAQGGNGEHLGAPLSADQHANPSAAGPF